MASDICSTSLNILKEKATPLVADTVKTLTQKNAVIWFPDCDSSPQQMANLQGFESEIYDCVLTGNFIKRFLEIKKWPDSRYRFWVLSEKVKNVLVRLLQFEEDEVQVLPRNLIIPAKKNFNRIDLSKTINFIFAGRLSPTKNLESLILTTYYLQKNYSLNCQLHLIGPEDNIPHPDRGLFHHSDYLTGMKSLVNSLDWSLPPVFYKKMSADEWLELKLNNQVLLNHSTFICEDFNVSLAQAQNKGWPSIISSFGANNDVSEYSSIVFPWMMIGRSDETIELIQIKSKLLADYIAVRLKEINQLTSDSRPNQFLNELPKTVSYKKLQSVHQILNKQFELENSQQDSFELAHLSFAGKGQKFFSSYRETFGQLDYSDSVTFIVNDFNEDANPKKIAVKEDLLKKLNEFKGRKIFFISILQLTSPESIITLSQSTEVYFPFAGAIYRPFQEVIRYLIPENCKLTTSI